MVAVLCILLIRCVCAAGAVFCAATGVSVVGCWLLGMLVMLGGLSCWLLRHKSGRSRGTEYALAILAFTTPWVSLLGSGAGLALGLVVLFVYAGELRVARVYPLLPFVALVLASGLVVTVLNFDRNGFADAIVSARPEESIRAAWLWLRTGSQLWRGALECALRLALMAGLFGLMVDSIERRKAFAFGLVLGLAFSFPLVVLQILSVKYRLEIGWLSQGSFWTGQGRYRGTFSDPNSFGIFSALVCAWGCAQLSRVTSLRVRGFGLIGVAAWLGLSFSSGSRSLLLGVMVCACFVLGHFGRRAVLWGLVVGSLAVAGLSFVAHELPGYLSVLPSAAQRMVASLDPLEAGKTFFSRSVFLSVASAIWADHFWLGVGLDQFRNYVVPYTHGLGFDVGLWSDNANNFYLGVAAELGVLGVIALALAFSGMRLRAKLWWLECAPIVIVLVLLWTGPHFSFDEVAILAAFLMSEEIVPKSSPSGWQKLAGACVVAALLVSFGQSRVIAYGWYPWEFDGQHYFRWSSRSARGDLCCDSSGKATVGLRTLDPRAPHHPQVVQLYADGGQLGKMTLSGNKIDEVSIECAAGETVPLSLVLDRVWVPKDVLGGGDHRVLGVQVVSSSGVLMGTGGCGR